ncbi:MAG: phosphohydrolase, partial [Clostridiales bacterium]|nr:phosphohydrolase [Clostridiales bacterium]
NLRSGEDFMYKHAISTAILIAMMTSHMGYTHQKQQVMVAAALLYDIGYGYVPKPILEKGMDLEPGDEDLVQHALERGLEYLNIFESDFEFFPRALALMRAYIYSNYPDKLQMKPDDDLKFMVQVLRVADHFDQMTAMNVGHEPMSEIMAMRTFSKDKKLYHPQTVSVLANCIHIVPRAASVDLSTGDKGIILVENPDDFMRPVVLRLSDNKIFDLSQSRDYREVQIVDIMKTMDNRIAVDEDTIKQFVPDKELSRITSKFRDALDRSATAG